MSARYWMNGDGTVTTTPIMPDRVRPVVVIDPDPEDESVQLQPMVNAYRAARSRNLDGISAMQAALRSLIALPHAVVPERGWGRNATVRDRGGVEWRHSTIAPGRWYRMDQMLGGRNWPDLDVAPDGILWVGAYDEAES